MSDENLDIHETYKDPDGKDIYRLVLIPDGELSDPTEDDGWKVYSFNSRHIHYRSPSDMPDLSAEVAAGLAFPLSYYEHGLCEWSLSGTSLAPDWQWDGVTFAGMLVWEDDPANLGPKSPEERTHDATNFIKIFTAWCNGEGYGYRIEQRVHVYQDERIHGPNGFRSKVVEFDRWEPADDEASFGFYGYDDVKDEAEMAWTRFLADKGLKRCDTAGHKDRMATYLINYRYRGEPEQNADYVCTECMEDYSHRPVLQGFRATMLDWARPEKVKVTKPCEECGATVTWIDDETGWEHPDNEHVQGSQYVKGWQKPEATCILTGDDGENADDCTTHEHETPES